MFGEFFSIILVIAIFYEENRRINQIRELHQIHRSEKRALEDRISELKKEVSRLKASSPAKDKTPELVRAKLADYADGSSGLLFEDGSADDSDSAPEVAPTSGAKSEKKD